MLALILIVVSLIFAGVNGFHLKQALDAEHELRSEMGELSLATMTDSHASSSTISIGEKSLTGALEAVRSTAHRDEVFVAIELLGLLAGLLLLRKSLTARTA